MRMVGRELVRRADEREQNLKMILTAIENHDSDYEARYDLVLHALHLARSCGFLAGVRLDPTEPEWPVAYIELPTGQVSWHLPQHPHAWDGHDTPEKYHRCREYADDVWLRTEVQG